MNDDSTEYAADDRYEALGLENAERLAE